MFVRDLETELTRAYIMFSKLLKNTGNGVLTYKYSEPVNEVESLSCIVMSKQNDMTSKDVCEPLTIGIDKENFKNKIANVALVFSAFGASLLIVGCGANYVWTSPVIWKLKSNDTNVNPLGQPSSTFQIALMAGLLPFGGLLSPIFLAKLCDSIGRKPTMIMLSTFMLLTNVTLAFSTTIYMYCISRFVIGLCVGGALSATSIFLSEISEDHNRGMIGCFMGVATPLGCLYAYIIGPFCSVRTFTLLCVLPNFFNILFFLIYIPETPVYLASKGDRDQTLRSLEKLRRKKTTNVKEYHTILEILKETSCRDEGTWSSLLSVRSSRKGLFIAVTLKILLQLSGIGVILTFAGPLFDSSGGVLSGDMTGVTIGFVKLASAVLAAVVIERLGRRPLLMASTLGGCVSNFSLGLFFYLKYGKFGVIKYLQWLPLLSVILHIVSFSLGLGVIPFAMMSELFPINMKSKTSSVCCSISQALMFLVTTIFPIMSEVIGEAWCIWVFSLSGFLGFLFVYYFIPEIKGRSLVEVQTLLSK